MRICVFGAGAVGGHVAAQLAASGHEVSVIARGAQLAAIRAHGVTLLKGERRITGRVQAAQDPREIGQVDYVIVTLKATSLPDFADAAAPLLGKDTPVVFAQNGIPWWYALGLSAARPAAPDLSALDPGGKLARAIAPERVVGSVVYSANEVVSPGVVRSNAPERNVLVLGAPDDRPSARLRVLAAALEKSEIQAPVESDIRRSVWAKLVINLWSSSIGVVTGGTVRENRADPALEALRPVMQGEARAIAAAHGVNTEGAPLPPQQPSGGPQHKSSMLQDYEQGRPMEVAAILMAPLWFARAAQVPAPTLETVIALAAHKARKKGLW
ncbi:MAG TPA: 2-dehydropantoate 2-reductase [Burkholderiales bacterium]